MRERKFFSSLRHNLDDNLIQKKRFFVHNAVVVNMFRTAMNVEAYVHHSPFDNKEDLMEN